MAEKTAIDRIMITILVKECNDISQEFYDECISSFQVSQLKCPGKECPCGTLILHGSYMRQVKNHSGKTALEIRRVQCTDCSATHALLPSFIVPYSQVPQRYHAAIAEAKENGENIMDVMDGEKGNPELSPSQVYYILKMYLLCWRQRILSDRIALSPLCALTQACFSFHQRPFMQIKATPNILFSPPT